MPASSLDNPADLLLRSVRACTVVALAEEFFWRGFLVDGSPKCQWALKTSHS